MFCGGGGSSLGARMAGAEIVGGAEIADYPSAAFKLNFPKAKLFRGDIRNLGPKELVKELGRLDLLLSSPECTNHTCAKGSAPRSEESRETALQVIRFAKAVMPRWIVLENVIHMRPWKRYPELKAGLVKLGYSLQEAVLDASHFGVPQKRKRLFVVASRDGEAPVIKSPDAAPKPASSIIDRRHSWRTSPLFTKKRATGTIERAERAIKALGNKTPFLLVYYGTDGSGGWQSLDVPLRTVTTLDRFALVEPSRDGHTMRMLQPAELRRAMGFPADYQFPKGPRREQIRLLGNAVCPPVMQRIIKALVQESG